MTRSTAREPLDIVVLGAQKSGSTFLSDIIHWSGLAWMQEDEVPIFEAPFFEGSDLRELDRAVAGSDRPLRGIKRADYLCRHECPANLAQVVPGAKLIAVLRHPIERALAAAAWYMVHGHVPVQSPELLLDDLLQRSSELVGREREILEFGRYGEAIARYLEFFDLDQLLLLEQGELRDIDGLLDRLAVFLDTPVLEGLDRSATPARSNEGAYHPLRQRVLRLRAPLIYDWEKGHRYEYRPHRQYRPVRTAIAAVPLAIDRFVLRPLLHDGPSPLSRDLVDRLADFYADDLDLLADVTDFDVDRWR
ncbi:MAG: hypothetical protein R2733_26780 [Acidimicrobiales bacterium]